MAELKKTCTKCKVEKPLDEFSVDKGLHGRRAQCRVCRNKAILNSMTPEKRAKRRAQRSVTLLKHPLYYTWSNMKKRCQNESAPDYSRYGGRGIKVCSRWQSFKVFETDMMPTYKKGLSLDRIDNNGNYCPENCRWATAIEQANNTRRVKPITFNGLTMTLNQWARHLGIKRSTLSMRHYGYGWPIEKTLSTL